ncbi:hypothetical protein L6164_016338 [Bauhinia variegata]|uniref:Uncharacterized protein n=1 Tax=Bauhinia variegata TaxID=167791 RepID=A0ACB9NNF0_BAUVA|nr:hypothetical protein L6164_016338 [Bauhinia variegata]
MGGKEFSGLDTIWFEKKPDSMYPMYFGVSCAFFALQVMSKPCVDVERWSEIRDNMLQGSAQLLGLLVWKVQKECANVGDNKLPNKLKSAEREIEDLKRMRHEDGKANEKVVGIFAAQEQSWLNERKKLRQHIGALINELRVLEKKKDETISELNKKLMGMEGLLESKDKMWKEEEQRRKELEEKLIQTERDAEELRESAERAAQEHSSELKKHKTAFIELVSNQRQLEAEIGRALKQVEAKNLELGSILKQKDEAELTAQKFYVEIAKLHNDLEQKDKILSAMSRKSKLDTEEKQTLLKEVKLSKAKRKQAEQEIEKWRAVSEGRRERQSPRSMLVNMSSRMDVFPSIRGRETISTATAHIPMEPEYFSPISDHYLPERNGDLAVTASGKRLEEWVRSEAEKYATMLEQRHHSELDAFAEQMRLKDEKLESFRWQLMRMELESKQVHSHVEGLIKDITQLRHEKMKLETLLLEKEEELATLKEQFASHMNSSNYCINNSHSPSQYSDLVQDGAVWSEVQVVNSNPGEEVQEIKEKLIEEDNVKEEKFLPHHQFNNADLEVHSQDNKFEEKDSPVQNGSLNIVEVDATEKIAYTSHLSNKANHSQWKMDLHALGVSYKIKRLKQQLILVERLIGKQANDDNADISDDSKAGLKAYLSLTSLLNKQVGRYQSLQEKTDDLCKRMHDNDLYANRGDMDAARTKQKTEILQHFLEETFQLQRYIVSTGQRLMELKSKVVYGFVGVTEDIEKSAGVDMKRFADSIRNLFQEVQRGLEIRTARIIGDLEGTLACEGMIQLRGK